jgi:hypothetical protein
LALQEQNGRYSYDIHPIRLLDDLLEKLRAGKVQWADNVTTQQRYVSFLASHKKEFKRQILSTFRPEIVELFEKEALYDLARFA